MIVRATPKGWEVIYHHAHALAAAQLAYQLAPRYRHPRWLEQIEAIAFHDDAQLPFSARNYLNPNGTPLDFTLTSYTLAQAEAVAAQAIFKSRRVGLLISLHMSYLYEPLAKAGKDTALKAFCKHQRQQQKRIIQALGLTPEQAAAEYELLRWCDQTSLYLCQNQVPAGGLRVETGPGPGGHNHLLSMGEPDHIYMNPWPFEAKEATVYCEVRHLHQLTFTSSEELLEVLQKAKVEERCWHLHPADAQPADAGAKGRARAALSAA